MRLKLPRRLSGVHHVYPKEFLICHYYCINLWNTDTLNNACNYGVPPLPKGQTKKKDTEKGDKNDPGYEELNSLSVALLILVDARGIKPASR